MSEQSAVSTLFLVRLWAHETGDGQSEWRGKVQHIVSGEARPFHDWAALEAAMIEMLEMLQQEVETGSTEGRELP
jgi:hypothetical protein